MINVAHGSCQKWLSIPILAWQFLLVYCNPRIQGWLWVGRCLSLRASILFNSVAPTSCKHVAVVCMKAHFRQRFGGQCWTNHLTSYRVQLTLSEVVRYKPAWVQLTWPKQRKSIWIEPKMHAEKLAVYSTAPFATFITSSTSGNFPGVFFIGVCRLQLALVPQFPTQLNYNDSRFAVSYVVCIKFDFQG